MLISCPKCKVSYAIEPEWIPGSGKKLRCAKCGEVWLCRPEDLSEPSFDKPLSEENDDSDVVAESAPVAEAADTSEAEKTEAVQEEEAAAKPEDTDMKEIFSRLSQQTESIFEQEKNIPVQRKLWMRMKMALGLQHKSNQAYLAGTILLLLLLSLFYFRFDIVRLMPSAEKAYSAVGIVSRIPGEGLEFQNVIRNEYEEDYVRKLEIKGFLANVETHTINVPVIHAELLDKDTNVLDVIEEVAPLKRLGAGSRMAFRIVIVKPALDTKYIYLTLVDKKAE